MSELSTIETIQFFVTFLMFIAWFIDPTAETKWKAQLAELNEGYHE